MLYPAIPVNKRATTCVTFGSYSFINGFGGVNNDICNLIAVRLHAIFPVAGMWCGSFHLDSNLTGPL